MKIIGLPALVGSYDNYIWILYQDHQAWAVDPGESQQVMAFLTQNQLDLKGILVTHHHFDHVDGIPALQAAYPDVTIYGPANPQAKFDLAPLNERDRLDLTNDFHLDVLATPGHTKDHISFVNDQALFCGDTLFTAGCGRLLGGTAQAFSDSILKLRALPDSIGFYCAHEYTADNLAFAALVEPDNAALQQRIQQTKIDYPQPQTGPLSLLSEEKQTNPFMRFDHPKIKAHLLARGAIDRPDSLFQTLRDWKDQFDQHH